MVRVQTKPGGWFVGTGLIGCIGMIASLFMNRTRTQWQCSRCGLIRSVTPKSTKQEWILLVLVMLIVIAFGFWLRSCSLIHPSGSVSPGRDGNKNLDNASRDRLETKEDLAASYKQALSDLCAPLGPSAHTEFNKNRNGYTLLLVCVGFAGHTLETSYPVKDRVTQWIALHHGELVNAKITRVGVKGPYPDIDSGSSWLDVR